MAAAHAVTIDEAVQRLRAGGVVAFPTETVYGLGADALNEEAVGRVYQLKGRPPQNPLIVHVDGAEMARRFVAAWPGRAQRLADRFWPGPLTMVLEKSPVVPALVTGGGPTVAMRCPDHPVALALIRAFGGPIVGPSANPSGRVSPTTPDHVRENLAGADVLLLDGGQCRAGIESTVLSLAHGAANVLRPGLVTREQIAAALDEPVGEGALERIPGAPFASPGMMERHYAPRAPAVLFPRDQWPEVIGHAAGPVVVLTHEPSRRAGSGVRIIRMPTEPGLYAARLYSALHEADALHPALVAIERPEGIGGVWDAIRDRLQRAAATAPRAATT